jgi:predicted DNA-binding transcriptional regulator AlpA
MHHRISRLFFYNPGQLLVGTIRSLSHVSSLDGEQQMFPFQRPEAQTASPARIAADDEVLLTAQQVRERLGGISSMTLWRWLGSDTVRFPQPTMRVNKRRFWSAGSIRRWLAEHYCEPAPIRHSTEG